MGEDLPAIDLGGSAVAIAAGGSFSCAQLDDGGVKCWGYNSSGILGQGDTQNRGDAPGELGNNLPIVDLDGNEPSALVTGRDGWHVCTPFDNGELRCWGRASNGQLGLGDENHRGDAPNEMGANLPPVKLGGDVESVYAGGAYNCVLLDGGDLKCWGYNASGMLGIGNTADQGDGPNEMGDSLAAIDFGGGKQAVSLATSSWHVCAKLDDDSVKCWGRNNDGQLGLGDKNHRGDAPNEMGNALPAVDLGEGLAVDRLIPGGAHSCVLFEDGAMKCWGRNSSGQLGLGDSNARGSGPNQMGDDLPLVSLD